LSQSPQKIKMLVWQVFAGSKGCINRIKIVSQLKKTPLNTNQLSNQLKLDYKIVEHHLDVLYKYDLVTKIGDRYGSTYFLSPLLESNLNLFNEMSDQATNCKENF